MAENTKGGVIKPVVCRLLHARAMLFGVVLLNFISEMVFVMRFERRSAFMPEHWNPLTIMTSPFFLLLGSVCLLIDRSWGYVLAILLAGNIVYSGVYRGLVGISYAHGIPMFSVRAARIWLQIMSSTQMIDSGLAAVILVFGIVQISRRIARQIHGATTP